MSSSSNEPPFANPVLTAYESFVDKTPLVTRYILTAQFLSYMTSWFIDPRYALSNILAFTVLKFEIYRLLLSPLVNTSFIALAFAYISFSDHGKRLELSMGSTAFAWLCLFIAFSSNVAFSFLCGIFVFVGGMKSYLFSQADGIWIILFGTVAIECVQASQRDRQQTRRLFMAQVPTLYYPLALYLFFAFLSANLSLSYLISLGIGYAIGYGYLDKYGAQLSSVTAKKWEESVLVHFTTRQGWITGQEVLGSGAWSDDRNSNNQGGMMLPLFQGGSSALSSSNSSAGAASTSSATGSASRLATPGTTGGRTLGGSGSTHATRRAVDPRQARLEAIERQQKQLEEQNQQQQQQRQQQQKDESISSHQSAGQLKKDEP